MADHERQARPSSPSNAIRLRFHGDHALRDLICDDGVFTSSESSPFFDLAVLEIDEEATLESLVALRESWVEPTLWVIPRTRAKEILAQLGDRDDLTSSDAPIAAIQHRLHRLATGRRVRDDLTGATTRHEFIERMNRTLAHASERAPVTLIMVNIDRFKSLNDHHGHRAGDWVLVEVAQRLRDTTPSSALVGRFSGDGFTILVPCDEGDATRLSKRIVERIRSEKVRIDDDGLRGVHITASSGAGTVTRVMEARHLIVEAEEALMSAKAKGRDRAVHFHELEREAFADDGSLMVQGFENLTRVISERVADVIARRGRHLFEQLRQQADHDALTGVYSRGYLDRRLGFEVAEAHRTRRPMCVALLDIDHFGLVNKTYGWPTGDLVLREVAQRIRSSLRDTDWVARYGGEEFCVVMHEARAADALVAMERIREVIRGAPFDRVDGDTLDVTASLGGTEVGADDTVQTTVSRISASLLEAKRAGRDRVVVS